MEYTFWAVSGLLVVAILFGFVVLWRAGRRRFSDQERTYIRKCWDDVRALQTRDAKFAVLEADKVLDYALTVLKYRGTVGEKLKLGSAHFSDLNAIWTAHKLRNQIAHEMQFVPTPAQVQYAIRAFEQALKDLKAL